MQGAAKGGTLMQATPYGLSKEGNTADFPEKSLVRQKIGTLKQILKITYR